MSVPMLTKMHMNGYDVLSVNNGPWRVCTKGDRLGAFGSREEARLKPRYTGAFDNRRSWVSNRCRPSRPWKGNNILWLFVGHDSIARRS